MGEWQEHDEADCYCNTCDMAIHHLGIASHRAAHRRRYEDCLIEYSDGRVWFHPFSEHGPAQKRKHQGDE